MTLSPCQSCGACCSYSEIWPRFTLESEAALARIPKAYMNARTSGMRCNDHRCTALIGKVGGATACAIYDVRPEVCKTCEPGDPECTVARRSFGMAALAA